MTNAGFDFLVRESCLQVQTRMMRDNYSLAHVDGAEMLCDEIIKRLGRELVNEASKVEVAK